MLIHLLRIITSIFCDHSKIYLKKIIKETCVIVMPCQGDITILQRDYILPSEGCWSGLIHRVRARTYA